MKNKKLIVSLMLALLLSCFTLKPVFAEDNVITNQNTDIEKGQEVETVLVFGHDAVIKGTVNEGVIVIDGNLDIQSSAHVHGLVLVVGGNIQQQPGAKVTQDVLSFAFGHGIKFGFLLAAILLVASWFARLAISLLFLILAVFAGWMLKDKLEPFESSIQRSPSKLLLIGAISSLLLTAIGLLLIVSVIGIPIAGVLLILPFIFFLIGLAAVGNQIGKRITGYEQRSPRMNLLYGSLIIVACMNFPFLGGLLILGLMWLSVGLMVLWLSEKVKSRKAKS